MTEPPARTDASQALPPQTFSGGYKAWVLAVLVVVYTSNFIDRTIVAVLGEAIKQDLKLADWQLGVLSGLSFAVFYTVMGIPIARLAERTNRVNLITVSLALWSGMTALCGLSQTYWQLLLCRMGVGVGEAGCSPASHSIISDYFGPSRRASALSVYSLGIPLGTLIGAVAGVWVAKVLDWRVAFLVVGLPGLLLAVIVRLCLREPPRGHAEPGRAIPEAPPSLGAVIRVLTSQPAFLHLAMGAALISFVGYGMGSFVTPYLVRAFGFDYAQAGLAWGMIGGISAGLGTLSGGPMADSLARRDVRWYAWTPAVGAVIAAPIYMAGFVQPAPVLAVAILLIPGIFHYLYLGPTFGVVHGMVEPRMRASATAILFLILNLIGLGLGPYVVGLASDLTAARLFSDYGMGAFAEACPGGRAAAGAAPILAGACQHALVNGIRFALVGTFVVLFWAALHYVLAARSLARAIEAGGNGP